MLTRLVFLDVQHNIRLLVLNSTLHKNTIFPLPIAQLITERTYSGRVVAVKCVCSSAPLLAPHYGPQWPLPHNRPMRAPREEVATRLAVALPRARAPAPRIPHAVALPWCGRPAWRVCPARSPCDPAVALATTRARARRHVMRAAVPRGHGAKNFPRAVLGFFWDVRFGWMSSPVHPSASVRIGRPSCPSVRYDNPDYDPAEP
jgi:hypothetical protein